MPSLSVTGGATIQKSLTVSGPMKIDGNNALEFGAGVWLGKAWSEFIGEAVTRDVNGDSGPRYDLVLSERGVVEA